MEKLTAVVVVMEDGRFAIAASHHVVETTGELEAGVGLAMAPAPPSLGPGNERAIRAGIGPKLALAQRDPGSAETAVRAELERIAESA